MNSINQKALNNLYHRYQNYDNEGKKYAFDITFTTLSNPTNQSKAQRHTGIDMFRKHVDSLMQDLDDVVSFTVTDYTGTSPRSSIINPPVKIELIDIKSLENTPKAIVHNSQPAQVNESRSGFDVMQGLSGLFAGTEFEGLGNLAPVAKFIDDKHRIDRLQEKNEELIRRNTELERQKSELSQKLEGLQDRYDQLEDDVDDLSDELTTYRSREKKQDKWVSMLGAAGASIAKNFLRQNPNVLSAIIPAEQLSGLLSDDEPAQETEPMTRLSDEERAKLEDATTVFEWLQAIDNTTFEQVMFILAAIRQNGEYAEHIITFLNGGKNNQLIKS